MKFRLIGVVLIVIGLACIAVFRTGVEGASALQRLFLAWGVTVVPIIGLALLVRGVHFYEFVATKIAGGNVQAKLMRSIGLAGLILLFAVMLTVI